jgi:hypothetical protein
MRPPSLLLLATALLGAPVRGADIREYQIKAVFLFNFAQFVDWPAGAFPQPESPLVIGILGEDPFGAYLDQAVRGETVNHRTLVIQRYRRVEDVAKCQILFISRSEAGHLEQILSALRGQSILTVSDADGFSREGGMIRFATENNKIRLKINLEAARAAGLKISSKLLRPAEIVSKR